jgi:hypothetical protein
MSNKHWHIPPPPVQPISFPSAAAFVFLLSEPDGLMVSYKPNSLTFGIRVKKSRFKVPIAHFKRQNIP